MTKNGKLKKIFSISLVIVFAVFSLLLSFPAGKNTLSEEQKLAIIMEKEAPAIKSLSSYNAETGMVEIDGSLKAFKEFRDKVNSDTTFSGITVKLMDDIDLSEVSNFTPIGNTSSKYFLGTFDGNGHSIKNLNITASSKVNVGLFGYSSKGTTIKNLSVTVGTITAYPGYSAGAIVGGMYGKTIISNCIVLPVNSNSMITSKLDTSIDAYANTLGGIAGYVATTDSASKIEQCANYVNIISNATKNTNIGGIAGYLNSSDTTFRYLTISQCYSNSSLSNTQACPNNVYIGGIIGGCATNYAVLNIYDCINKSSFSAISDRNWTDGSDDTITTGTLRPEAIDVDMQYALQNNWDNSTYKIKVGGILGYTSSSYVTISNCVNTYKPSADSTSPLYIEPNTYENIVYYFYGRLGDKISGYCGIEQWYGDMFYIGYDQTIQNYREISHGGNVVNCVAPKHSDYYTKRSSVEMLDAISLATITSKSDPAKFTFSSVPITDIFGSISDRDDETEYVTYTGSTTGDFYLGASKITKADTGGHTFYEGMVYNGHSVYQYLYLNRTTTGFKPGTYIPAIITTTGMYKITYNLMSNILNYLSANSTIFDLGNTYTPYFNSRFESSNHAYADDYRDKSDPNTNVGIDMMRSAKFSSKNNGTKIELHHEYSYDYDSGGLLTFENATKTHDLTLCTIDDKYVSDNVTYLEYDASNPSNTVKQSNGFSSSVWQIVNGEPTFKWMYWSNSATKPGS